MAIEIVYFLIDSMVDLSTVVLNYQRVNFAVQEPFPVTKWLYGVHYNTMIYDSAILCIYIYIPMIRDEHMPV